MSAVIVYKLQNTASNISNKHIQIFTTEQSKSSHTTSSEVSKINR